jgi:DNA-directed RNA polymerase III subunit RPC8
LVPEKGLALSVYDVLTAEDGKVTWGNGMMYYKGKLWTLLHNWSKKAERQVSFRLMLFAPFIGEVITGKIISTSKSYIRGKLAWPLFDAHYKLNSLVSIDFFRDIYIVPSLLPPNSI